MIRSFRDRLTETINDGTVRKGFPADLVRRAQQKLELLDAAVKLTDLLTPKGNRLEPLAGNRQGQHSIRVNDKWRICFVWTDSGPEHVEITDYH